MHYRKPPSVLQNLIVQGRPTAGGCELSMTVPVPMRGKHPGKVLRYDETAYDPTTCTSEIAVSLTTPARRPGNADTDHQSSGVASAPTVGAGQPGGGQGIASTCVNPARDTSRFYSHSYCIHSWFEDPPGLHVNDVTNEVQWNPANGCATWGWSYASAYLQWLAGTGWRLLGHNFFPEASSHEAIFENTTFCAPFTTLTGYNQRMTGQADGGANWEYRWAKNGVCSFLLSFHTEQN